MSNNKGLHTAIKEVMKQFGDDILASPKLVNYLADYSAFRDYPQCKVILKGLQEQGEMQKVYDAYKGKGKNCRQDIDDICHAVQKQGKFKRSLLTYIFSCILYAIDIVNNVAEPENIGFGDNAFRQESASILDNLEEMLGDLKQEYVDLLEKLAILPKDLLRDPAGYYPVEALNQLYLVEAKYKVVANQLGDPNIKYCKCRLDDKLEEFRRAKSAACSMELAKQQDLYSKRLQKARPNVDSKKEYPTDFDKNSIEELAKIEAEIKRLYGELGRGYDEWCTTKKQERLKKFQDEYVSVRKGELSSWKSKYEAALKKAKPKLSPITQKPLDVDDDTNTELSRIEKEIRVIYQDTHQTYDDWCGKAKEKRIDGFLADYHKKCESQLQLKKGTYSTLLKNAKPNTTGFVRPTGIDSETKEELSKLEQEIVRLHGELGLKYDNWCKSQEYQRVQELITDFINHCKESLHSLKADYVLCLEAALIKKKGIISRSAVYDQDSLEALKSKKQQIKELCSEVGERYDNFCENKRDEIFNKYQVSPQKQRKQILYRIVIPAIIALFPISWAVQYAMFKGDIDKFDNQMTQAHGLLDQGDNRSALLAYDEAGDSYDHAFLGKKGEANEAIDGLVTTICNEANSLIDQNKFTAAKAKLNEIPSSIFTDREELKSKVNSVNEKMTQAIASVRDKLIANISKNGGKLDGEGKKLLDEALLASPDDYWLKFIKSKEK